MGETVFLVVVVIAIVIAAVLYENRKERRARRAAELRDAFAALHPVIGEVTVASFRGANRILKLESATINGEAVSPGNHIGLFTLRTIRVIEGSEANHKEYELEFVDTETQGELFSTAIRHANDAVDIAARDQFLEEHDDDCPTIDGVRVQSGKPIELIIDGRPCLQGERIGAYRILSIERRPSTSSNTEWAVRIVDNETLGRRFDDVQHVTEEDEWEGSELDAE